jgi:hypothetical protein
MAELGKALALTDEDLDRLAEVTEEDILKTNNRWVQVSSRWAKNLLVAESAGGENNADQS